MFCWNCGAPLNLLRKISFRETCEACHASLHCCQNCIFYKPGLPNDCRVPNRDFVADRTANNFCEEFKLLGKAPEKKINPNDVAQKLFGEEKTEKEEDDPKERFRKLFE